jgi:homopolymeric O-antigen transport system ATP-binding protein
VSNLAIRVENLGKRYQRQGAAPYRTLRDSIASTLGAPFRRARTGPVSPRVRREEFWALRGVSFEVKQGEVLGIIGHNGAGKSTLLKILAGITEPSLGRAAIRGRMGSLLEVGTGFHPELTGRENLFLNGAILGMSRTEISRKFDEIVAFAEVEPFIDTPVKHYSTGMYLRLAFAVAAHLDPEILLIDEVLAVGDAAFQKKCLGKMGEVASAGRTVLFVSHNLAAVQQLTRTSLLLRHGQLAAQGPSSDVISAYLSAVLDRSGTVYDVADSPRRWPELRREVEFLRVELEDHPNRLVPPDAEMPLRLTVRANQTVSRFRFSVTIFQADGTPVGNVFGPEVHALNKGEIATFRMTLHDMRLARGNYHCALATGTGSHLEQRMEFDIILDVLHFEVLGPLRADGVMSEWFSVWGPIRFAEPRVIRVE